MKPTSRGKTGEETGDRQDVTAAPSELTERERPNTRPIVIVVLTMLAH